MLRIAVLVSGGGTNLQAIIDAKKNGMLEEVEIACVMSNKPGAGALKRGIDNVIETICVEPKNFPDRNAYGEQVIKELNDRKVDLVVLAGFLVILPENLTKAFAGKMINIHPSLIPSFCGDGFYGLKVHEEALKRGVKVTGATVHFVNEECDGGPIIAQKAVYIQNGDTPEVLQRRVMEEAEWVILPKVIDDISRGKVSIVDGIARVEED